MATLRQKRLAKAIVDNALSDKPKNKQQLVASVGYTDASADKKATEILESKGTQEELQALGFTKEGAMGVVEELLYDKGQKGEVRLKASDQVFKVTGAYAPEKHAVTVEDVTPTEKIKKLAERLNK